MDAPGFDSLLRSLSMTPSRRDALRVLTGAALGSLLGLEHEPGAAKRKKRKKKRRRDAPA